MGGKRFRRLQAGVLLVVALVTIGHQGNATTNSVVVLGIGSFPGLSQIQAELSALQIRAIVIDTAAAGSVSERLVRATRDWGTTVAIEFVSQPDELQVWLYDTRTGEPPHKQAFHRDRGGSEEARVEALSVAEYLRAVLIEARPTLGDGALSRKPAHARRRVTFRAHRQSYSNDWDAGEVEDAGPEDSLEDAPVRGIPSLWISYSSGALFSGGGRLAAESALGVSWQVTRRLTLELRTMLPLSSARFSGAGGSAEYRVWGVGTGARYSLTEYDSPVRAMVAAGGSWLGLPVGGTQASPGYRMTPTTFLQVAAPYVELGLLWRAREWFSIGPALWAAYAFPEPIVRFAGHDVARPGRPLVFLAIRVEWRAIDWGATD